VSANGAPGLIIAAPASGHGKTVTTLALARAFRHAGFRVATAKVGPDYIDPGFHAVASGRDCVNLDPWAMRLGTLAALVDACGRAADIVLCEGVMGLFDGIDAAGRGSTADLAALTGWPVILVVDVRGQAASAAALVAGFARHRADVPIAGVIFNRAGGARHQATVREAVRAALPTVPILGALARDPALVLPERHLGLVQARERADLDGFLDRAATAAAAAIDLAALLSLARPARLQAAAEGAPIMPLGQRIAVARDDAFAFAYPWLLDSWRRRGADLHFFSPLADEAPPKECDAVYLPGGYPELHTDRLAGNRHYVGGLRAAAASQATVYGECGGYMALGRALIDAEGRHHEMAGLLPLETSFAQRRLHLGYRHLRLASDTPGLGATGCSFRGHEFHYASTTAAGGAEPLFRQTDAAGHHLEPAGLRVGSVMGSFAHLIDIESAV
jgi:cobyrinic acid a,c-diamide synthase